METTKIAVFKGKQVRKTLHNNEWWFSVADVVEALTDTPNSTDYIKKIRKRDAELAKGWGQIVPTLLMGGLLMLAMSRNWIPTGIQFVPPLNYLSSDTAK